MFENLRYLLNVAGNKSGAKNENRNMKTVLKTIIDTFKVAFEIFQIAFLAIPFNLLRAFIRWI